MPTHLRYLIPLLLLPVAGCGSGDDERNTGSGLETRLNRAIECMGVHAALITAPLNLMTVAQNPADADEAIAGMRDITENLPMADAGEPNPRDAYHSITDQIESIRGAGLEAAQALSKSPRYQADTRVLADWHAGHCETSENRAPAQA